MSYTGEGRAVRLSGLLPKPNAFCLITTCQDRLPPQLVVDIPAKRFLNSSFEILLGAPTEFTLKFRGIDGIAAVVARTVSDEADQASMRAGRIRDHGVEQFTDGLYDMQIGALVATANIIGLADLAVLEHKRQRPRVILDIEPVTDVL